MKEQTENCLYNIGKQILTDAGFEFVCTDWRKVEGKNEFTPGIMLVDLRNGTEVTVNVVTDCDVWSDCVLIDNDVLLVSTLSVLIHLINNWHDKVDQLREEIV